MKQQTLEDEPREHPYVWPSWITKPLAGENKCWYAPWYKAHFKYRKRADDKDREAFFKEFNETHDRITNRRVAALRADGWTVKVEEEGEFKIRGRNGATLSGKPDIVAMKDQTAIIVDSKSGKPRVSDHWQVLLYMLFLPLSWLKGFPDLYGEVEYRDGAVDVRPMTGTERKAIEDAMRLVTGDKAPDAAPSRMDCKFCDIARCQYREPDSPDGNAEGMF